MNRWLTSLLLVVSFYVPSWASAEETEPGFVSLFDGKSLAGWVSAPGAYAVEDGAIVCVAGSKGNLLSEKDYGDFVLRLEYKLEPGGNNGGGAPSSSGGLNTIPSPTKRANPTSNANNATAIMLLSRIP